MLYWYLLRAFGVAVWLVATSAAVVPQEPSLGPEPNLRDEQKEAFPLNAQVVNSVQISKGITHPWRLTLSDGTLTHDAASVNINVSKPYWKGADERAEIGFGDTYHFNIAARKLAELLESRWAIPQAVAGLLSDLRALRNQAVHAGDFDVTAAQAIE